MATIGTFTKSPDGFTGTLKTLVLVTKVAIRPVEKEHDKAPDFRFYAGSVAFGAGWTKFSRDGRAYIAAKLDDPSFAAPVYATLTESEAGSDTYNLIWSR